MFKKRSSYFYSICLPIILIGITLVVGFSTYIYKETAANIRKQLIVGQENFTRQVQNNLEQRVKRVEYTFTNYSSTTGFKELLKKPLTPQNFAKVEDISLELVQFGMAGNDGTEYSLASLNQKWLISSGNSLRQLADEEVHDYQELISSGDNHLFWIPSGKQIKMVVSLPIFSSPQLGVGIAKIQKSSIEEIIGRDNLDQFAIYDKHGQTLFQNKLKVDEQVKSDLLKSIATEGTVEASNGDRYIFQHSSYNNWLYLTKVTQATMTKSTQKLLWGLLIINIFVVTLLCGLAYFIASHAAGPIRVINEKISKINSSEGPHTKSEIKQILAGIETMATTNLTLTSKIDSQKSDLNQLFVVNLFRNRILSSNIKKQLLQFGYPTGDVALYVILIQIDDLGVRSEDARDVLLLSIEELVTEIIPTKDRMRPIILDHETQATVITLAKNRNNKKAQLIAYCETIQKMAYEFLKIKISFGISKQYPQYDQISLAEDDAREALHFRINLGPESIIFYDELTSNFDEKVMMKYPTEEERLLLDHIRSGSKEEIIFSFNQALDFIFAANTSPVLLETAILKFANNVMVFGQQLGADAEVIHQNRRVYSELINTDNRQKIYHLLLESLILPIAQSTQDKTNQELFSISEKMVHLVHQQYDQNLTLDDVSAQLHYNATYLSSIFKKERGLNFGDFLQNYRLEVAKKWLLETDMTIKDMASRLQYNNPQNFIRFFKKFEGMTPGEYRKEHE